MRNPFRKKQPTPTPEPDPDPTLVSLTVTLGRDDDVTVTRVRSFGSDWFKIDLGDFTVNVMPDDPAFSHAPLLTADGVAHALANPVERRI